jgi:hypothetical protein
MTSVDLGDDLSVFEKLSRSLRTGTVVAWATAGERRLSPHVSQGLRPLRSRYSLMVIVPDGNVSGTTLQVCS